MNTYSHRTNRTYIQKKKKIRKKEMKDKEQNYTHGKKNSCGINGRNIMMVRRYDIDGIKRKKWN